MVITHLGHSCVLVEAAGKRILIDPGNFSDAWRSVSEVDAVLVTHQHADHADPERLPAYLAEARPALVAVERSVPDMVPGLPDTTVMLAPGITLRLGDVTICAVGGQHAVIHRDIPRIGNTGLLLAAEGEPTVFHPGDALDTAPPGVDVVLVPAHAPWSATKEVVDFVRATAAPTGFLIHDGLLNERGYSLVKRHLANLTDTELADVRDSRPWQVGARPT